MEVSGIGRGTTSLFLASLLSLIGISFYFVVLTNFLRPTRLVGVVTSLNIFIWLVVPICLSAQPVVQGGGPIPAPLALLKFVPKYFANNQRGSAAQVFRFSLALSTAGGLIAMGLLMVLPTFFTPFLGGVDVHPDFVRLSAVDILIISIGQVFLGEIFALGNAKLGSTYIVVWSIGRATLASLLLIPYGIEGVLIGWIGGDLLLLALAGSKTLSAFSVQRGASGFSAAELERYNLYTLLAAMLAFIVSQADRIVTFSQRGLSGLAIYNAASVGAGLAGYVPSALVTVLLPALAARLSLNDVESLRIKIRLSTRYLSLLAMPIAFGLAGLMEIPLGIFGPDYLGGLQAAVILAVAMGLTSISAVYAVALLSQGNLRLYTIGNVLGLIALFLIAGSLTPIIGLNGPALGKAGLMIVVTVVYALASAKAKIFEIDARAFVFCSISATIMMVTSRVILSLLHSFLLKVVALPILVCIELLVYTVTLRIFRFVTAEDVSFISRLLPRRLHGIIPLFAWLVGIEFPQEPQY
jgi:O-antigen/teichoic acid export membrane protein